MQELPHIKTAAAWQCGSNNTRSSLTIFIKPVERVGRPCENSKAHTRDTDEIVCRVMCCPNALRNRKLQIVWD
jgi:hypothetical protein